MHQGHHPSLRHRQRRPRNGRRHQHQARGGLEREQIVRPPSTPMTTSSSAGPRWTSSAESPSRKRSASSSRIPRRRAAPSSSTGCSKATSIPVTGPTCGRIGCSVGPACSAAGRTRSTWPPGSKISSARTSRTPDRQELIAAKGENNDTEKGGAAVQFHPRSPRARIYRRPATPRKASSRWCRSPRASPGCSWARRSSGPVPRSSVRQQHQAGAFLGRQCLPPSGGPRGPAAQDGRR